MFESLLNKIFGNRHEKDVKLLLPIVDEINVYDAKFDSLTDEELKAKTAEFKARVKSSVKELEENKKTLQERLQNEALESTEILDITQKIKDLGDEIFQTTNDLLDEILPEAFAVVK